MQDKSIVQVSDLEVAAWCELAHTLGQGKDLFGGFCSVHGISPERLSSVLGVSVATASKLRRRSSIPAERRSQLIDAGVPECVLPPAGPGRGQWLRSLVGRAG